MSDAEPQLPADGADGAGGIESGAGSEAAAGEGAAAGADTETVTAAAPVTTKVRRGHLPRRISAWVLVVLASILIPVSVISVWAIRTVTDTDQYVATLAPLARNPVIIDHLAEKATDALFSTGVVKDKVTDALPAKAKPFVTPIVSGVHTYVEGLAVKVFLSPQFGKLWDTLNRHSHDAAINVLTGKQTPRQKKLAKGAAIALNLRPELNKLISAANSHGVTIFNPVQTISNQSLTFTVVTQQQVSKFSGAFNLIVKLKWIVPIIALVLAILSVVIAIEHRKTLLRLAIGVALFTLVILAGLSLGRITFLNHAGGSGFNTNAAGAVWDTLLRYLKTDLRWTLLVVVLVAFGAWVAGPGRYAVWIRSACAKGGRWVGAQGHAISSGTGRAAAGSERARRTGGWIVEHLNGLRILGVIVAGLFLVFGGNLTGWSLLVIVIVLAVYLGLLQLVAAWARNVSGAGSGASSGADPGSDPGPTVTSGTA
jgi:hypothetical protein